jgi:hypothetical protein
MPSTISLPYNRFINTLPLLAIAILEYFYFTKAQPSALLPKNTFNSKQYLKIALVMLRNKTIQNKIL